MRVVDIPDGTDTMPEGARDAIEIVKKACLAVNGGFRPIVHPFMNNLGAFVVCMEREPVAQDERRVREASSTVVLSACTEEAANRWIGEVMMGISIEGAYAVVYVTDRGSIDVYPPFNTRRMLDIDMVVALKIAIEEHKPVNRMPNLKLVSDQPEPDPRNQA